MLHYLRYNQWRKHSFTVSLSLQSCDVTDDVTVGFMTAKESGGALEAAAGRQRLAEIEFGAF